jgi:adenylate cyclase class 1
MFWQPGGRRMRFWVTDETGSLYGWSQPWSGSRRQALLPLMRFIENLAERRQLRQMAGAESPVAELVCSEVVVQGGEVRLERTPLAPESLSLDGMQLQAVGVQQGDGSLRFDLFCDEQEFSFQEYGDRLIPAVAHYIRSLRKSRESYPVYLTDVHLPHDLDPQVYQQDIQTIQYLYYRNALEESLNRYLAD